MNEVKTALPKTKKKSEYETSPVSAPLKVIIIEDFKLTRVGLRCA